MKKITTCRNDFRSLYSFLFFSFMYFYRKFGSIYRNKGNNYRKHGVLCEVGFLYAPDILYKWEINVWKIPI